MFEKGELVLIHNPGLHSKLDSVWDGPFQVIEVPNDMHLIIATFGKKHKRVHANLCKKFSTPESLVHATSWIDRTATSWIEQFLLAHLAVLPSYSSS